MLCEVYIMNSMFLKPVDISLLKILISSREEVERVYACSPTKTWYCPPISQNAKRRIQRCQLQIRQGQIRPHENERSGNRDDQWNHDHNGTGLGLTKISIQTKYEIFPNRHQLFKHLSWENWPISCSLWSFSPTRRSWSSYSFSRWLQCSRMSSIWVFFLFCPNWWNLGPHYSRFRSLVSSSCTYTSTQLYNGLPIKCTPLLEMLFEEQNGGLEFTCELSF